MSNPNNPNFVSELVQMAKAFEELPKVQADLHYANDQVEAYAKQVQALEMRLIDRANELSAAHAATRKAEVERDDAERMFLEADDKLNGIKAFLSNQIGSAQSLFAALEPPKPEPQPVTELPPQEVNQAADPDIVTQDEVENIRHEAVTPTDESGQSAGFTATADRLTEALTVGAESAAGEQSGSDPAPIATSPLLVETSDHTANSEQASEVALQPDPTPATAHSSESAYSGSTLSTGQREADPTPATDAISTEAVSSDVFSVAQSPATSALVDDVGYHNEPKIDHNLSGSDAWSSWDAWCLRMNVRYGCGGWPQRQQAAQ